MPVRGAQYPARIEIFFTPVGDYPGIHSPTRMEGCNNWGAHILPRLAGADRPNAYRQPGLDLFPNKTPARECGIIKMWGEVNPLHAKPLFYSTVLVITAA
jgi:hypothetical protein